MVTSRRASIVICLLCLLQPTKSLAGARWQLGSTLGPEYDSNARRAVAGAGVFADGLMRSTLSGQLQWRAQEHELSASAALGAKVFSTQLLQNTAVGLADLRYRYWGWGRWFVGADLTARGRTLLIHDRDYASGNLDLVLGRSGVGPASVELRLGPRAFAYLPDANYNNLGASAGLSAQLRLLRRERLWLSYRADLRHYPTSPSLRALQADGGRVYSDTPRQDLRHIVSLRLISARQVFASLAYDLLINSSNSLGESYQSHRFLLVLATELPLRLFAQITLGLQVTRYPGGLALSQGLLIEDSDESQNRLVLVLRRPISDSVAIEWKLGFYQNELSDTDLSFRRSTSYLGLRATL